MDRLNLFEKGRRRCDLRAGVLVCLMVAAFALFAGDAGAARLTFAWSLEEGAAGYRLYHGPASHTYSTIIDVGNTDHYSLDIADGPAYYFALTAYDSSHLESDYSNEIVYAGSPSCSYSISPESVSVDARGGTATVTVSAPADCSWSASAGAAWLRVASGSTGKGNGKVVYSAQSNAGPQRTSVSTVAGQLFTVTQGAPASASCRLNITKTGAGRGMVFRQPAGWVFPAGATVTMRALAGFNSWFAGWSGPCSGSGPICRVAMAGDVTVEARFARFYKVTASHGPHGSISPKGFLKVRDGETLSFTVTPKDGYSVRDVLVDGVSVGPVHSYTLQVDRNYSITARFGK